MDTSGLLRSEYCIRLGLSLFLVERRTVSLVTPEPLLISLSFSPTATSFSAGTSLADPGILVGKYSLDDDSVVFTSFSGSVRDEATGRTSRKSPASVLHESPHGLSDE